MFPSCSPVQASFCLITQPALPNCLTFPPEDPRHKNGVKDLPLRSSASDCLVQKQVLQLPGDPHRLPWRQSTSRISGHGGGAVTCNHVPSMAPSSHVLGETFPTALAFGQKLTAHLLSWLLPKLGGLPRFQHWLSHSFPLRLGPCAPQQW